MSKSGFVIDRPQKTENLLALRFAPGFTSRSSTYGWHARRGGTPRGFAMGVEPPLVPAQRSNVSFFLAIARVVVFELAAILDNDFCSGRSVI
jgi:hypothetical protein